MYQSSALTPSGTRSSTPTASAAPAVVTRSTPSAPRPRRRSHNADTTAGVSVNAASRSSSTTKSFWVPCPLAKRITCSGYVPPRPQCRVGVTSRGCFQPVDPVMAAKPRPLPSHVAARADERRLARRVAVSARIEVGEYLRVAQRPGRGDAVAQATAEQCGHLVDQAFGEHCVGALRQTLIETLCVAI